MGMRGRQKLYLDESSCYGRPKFPMETIEENEFNNKDLTNLKMNRKRDISSSESSSSSSSSSSNSSSENEEIEKEIQETKKTRVRKPLQKRAKWTVDSLKKNTKSRNTKGLKLKISKK